jgi:hypothetical protein
MNGFFVTQKARGIALALFLPIIVHSARAEWYVVIDSAAAASRLGGSRSQSFSKEDQARAFGRSLGISSSMWHVEGHDDGPSQAGSQAAQPSAADQAAKRAEEEAQARREAEAQAAAERAARQAEQARQFQRAKDAALGEMKGIGGDLTGNLALKDMDTGSGLKGLGPVQPMALKEIGTATQSNAAKAAAILEPKREQIIVAVEGDRKRFRSQLQKLMVEADKIVVPVPTSRLTPNPIPGTHIHDGIILGLNDPVGDVISKYGNAHSPYTGKPYDRNAIFATTDAKDGSEAVRGLMDNHYLGEYTLNNEYGKKLISQLNGTQFDRLTAHSNGATVAEALIRRGVIKVDELNIVGGDRSMINQLGYMELINSGKVKRIVVWTNPGDFVPLGSSSAILSPFGPTASLPATAASQYFAEKILGINNGGDARVTYRPLSGTHYKGQDWHLDSTIMDAHSLKDAYIPNIAAYFVEHNPSLK